MWAVWKLISFFFVWFSPFFLFSFGVCLVSKSVFFWFFSGLGFLFDWFWFIFSKGYIFSLWTPLLWSSSQCDCPSTCPIVFGGWKGLCSRWGMKAEWFPAQFVFRCTLFSNVDIQDQFLEKWGSTMQYSDWYCSLAPEKLMAALSRFFSLLSFISEDNLLYL